MLAAGDPAHEIARVAGEQAVDLIAMATHGHRLVGDLIHGATASHVRHAVRVPVLFVRVRD
jgi:nucleotide-binding universal stress UspA family protein